MSKNKHCLNLPVQVTADPGERQMRTWWRTSDRVPFHSFHISLSMNATSLYHGWQTQWLTVSSINQQPLSYELPLKQCSNSWYVDGRIFQTWFHLAGAYAVWDQTETCALREKRKGASLLSLFFPQAKRLLCTTFDNKLKHPLSSEAHDRCLSFIKTEELLKRVVFLVSPKQWSLVNKQYRIPCLLYKRIRMGNWYWFNESVASALLP